MTLPNLRNEELHSSTNGITYNPEDYKSSRICWVDSTRGWANTSNKPIKSAGCTHPCSWSSPHQHHLYFLCLCACSWIVHSKSRPVDLKDQETEAWTTSLPGPRTQSKNRDSTSLRPLTLFLLSPWDLPEGLCHLLLSELPQSDLSDSIHTLLTSSHVTTLSVLTNLRKPDTSLWTLQISLSPSGK